MVHIYSIKENICKGFQYPGIMVSMIEILVSGLPDMALTHRNGGSQVLDRWLSSARNIQVNILMRRSRLSSVARATVPDRQSHLIVS